MPLEDPYSLSCMWLNCADSDLNDDGKLNLHDMMNTKIYQDMFKEKDLLAKDNQRTELYLNRYEVREVLPFARFLILANSAPWTYELIRKTYLHDRLPINYNKLRYSCSRYNTIKYTLSTRQNSCFPLSVGEMSIEISVLWAFSSFQQSESCKRTIRGISMKLCTSILVKRVIFGQ